MRMRVLPLASFALVVALAACLDVSQNSATGGGGGTTGAGGDGGAADAAVAGQGCGIDMNTGITLCRETAQCANVVVDGTAFPDCGFRIRGSAVDLVCACQSSLCPMGAFVTCDQAAKLLVGQTEASICAQVADGRCSEITSSSSSSTSSSSSSSSSSS
ncbi:MAG TPA: hypothetical protein VIF62_13720, partial [Labilithrix sp.]